MDKKRKGEIALISFHVRLDDVPSFLVDLAAKAEDIIDDVGAEMCTQKQYLNHKISGRTFFTDEIEEWSTKLQYSITLLNDIKRLSESLTQLDEGEDGPSTDSEGQSKTTE